MLALLAIVIGAFVAYHALKSRLNNLEETVAALRERLTLLEAANERRERSAALVKPGPAEAVPPVQPRIAPGPASTPVATERPIVPRPVPPAPAPAPPVARARQATARAENEAPPAVVASRAEGESLETRIGSRWLLYIGVCSIVIGVAYFEKLAMDRRWIGDAARVVQGAIAGFAFIAGGLRFVRKGLRLYGHVLSGTGIALLYVSIYAAFNFYHLIDHPAAFAMMSGVTLVAAALADQQISQLLALFAVGGGFATPFLLASHGASQVALFGYDTVLIAGTLFIARRRGWPVLNAVGYVFTVLTVMSWASTSYRTSEYLTTELFITLFCGMYLYAWSESRHSRHPAADFVRAVLASSTVPYYIASLAILERHTSALLAYLVLLASVGVVAGSRTNPRVRLTFWAAASMPLVLWSNTTAAQDVVGRGLVAWAAVYALNLAGLLEATLREDRRFGDLDVVHLHLNGLVAYAGVYLLLNPAGTGAAPSAAAAMALFNMVVAVAVGVERRDEALHFLALAFTLLTIAIGLQLEGAWLTMAWAAEGAIVVTLALREGRVWLRFGGLFLVAVAIERLFLLQASEPAADEMLLLNQRALCGLFVTAMVYLTTLAHHRLGAAARRADQTSIGLVAATLLVLTVAGGEIVAYWKLHEPPPFEPGSELTIASLTAGAAIFWLGLARKQDWARSIGGVIIALATVSILSSQFEPAPTGYAVILNGRFGAGLYTVLLLYGLAALNRRLGDEMPGRGLNVAVLTTGAGLLTLSMLTSEIDAFWSARGAISAASMGRESLQVIAWAAIGSLLIWRAAAGWTRGIGAVILVCGVARLLRLQFFDASSGYVMFANPRVVAAVGTIALLYGLARLYANTETRGPRTALLLVANGLTLALLTSEITAYWHLREFGRASGVVYASSDFAREMMLSVTWALYATALIVVGLMKRYAPIRYFAIAVFVVTITKVFAIDLAELDQIYRILSVIGLGAALLVSSYLYQRFRQSEREA